MNSITVSRNERIVQLLYRRLKEQELTPQEQKELQDWLDNSESNQRILDNLSNIGWLNNARNRYYAPGKEEGLAMLKEKLFKHIQKKPRPRWYNRWLKSFAEFLKRCLNFIAPVDKNQ